MRRKIVLLLALVLPGAQAGNAEDASSPNPATPPVAGNALFDSLSLLGRPEAPGDTSALDESFNAQPFREQAAVPAPPADAQTSGFRPQGASAGASSGVGATRPVAAIGPIAFGGQPSTAAGGPANLMTAGDMIGFSRDLGEGVQAITIINASQRWMAVYHIDNGGQIRLTSSRPLEADFTIQFNASSPLPEEIRRLQGK